MGDSSDLSHIDSIGYPISGLLLDREMDERPSCTSSNMDEQKLPPTFHLLSEHILAFDR